MSFGRPFWAADDLAENAFRAKASQPKGFEATV